MSLAVLPGVGPAIWNGDQLDIGAARPEVQAWLRTWKPDFVMLHAGPQTLLDDMKRGAAHVRRASPDTRIWVGVGVDGWTARVGANPSTLASVRALACRVVNAAHEIDAETIVWDQEGQAKAHPEGGKLVARACLEAVRERAPTMPQGHTAYCGPDRVLLNTSGYPWQPGEPKLLNAAGQHQGWGGQGRYPQSAWTGGVVRVDFEMPQIYSGTGANMAAPGALRKELARSRASYAQLTARGGYHVDVAWHPYVQLHHVAWTQTANVMLDQAVVCGWALYARVDPDGWVALEGMVLTRREGLASVEDVRAFQSANGLAADGVVGTNTLATLRRLHGPAA